MYDRVNGALDVITLNNADLEGYHGGDESKKAYTFDEQSRMKAQCFTKCWAKKVGDALLLGALSEMKNKAGLLGLSPWGPSVLTDGIELSDFDLTTQSGINSTVGSIGRGINHFSGTKLDAIIRAHHKKKGNLTKKQ